MSLLRKLAFFLESEKTQWLLLLGVVAWAVIRFWTQLNWQPDMAAITQAYSRSQYVLGEGSPQKIDDSTLYVYAGMAYWRGEDPTTINFEHPPLAKYWYGLSWLLTSKPFFLNPVLYGLSAFCLWQLTKLTTQTKWLSSLALIGYGSFTLLQSHMAEGMLDLPLLTTNLLFFYLILKHPPARLPFITTYSIGLALAASWTIKYPFPMQLLVLAVPIAWWWRRETLINWVGMVLGGITGYLLVYGFFFYHQHSLIDWLRFEWYRVHWWFGERTMPKWLIIQTIFTGQFKGWWLGEVYEKAHWWQMSWPVLCVSSLLTSLIQLISGWSLYWRWLISLFDTAKNAQLTTEELVRLRQMIISAYAVALLLLYGLGSAAYERYLVLLLPLWLLQLLQLLEKAYVQKK